MLDLSSGLDPTVVSLSPKLGSALGKELIKKKKEIYFINSGTIR